MSDRTDFRHDDLRYDDLALEDRLATVDFRDSGRAHITVDTAVCGDCALQPCVFACPAGLFVPTAAGGIVFNYEQCLECGACHEVCTGDGALSWSYPEGGHGVVFRLG